MVLPQALEYNWEFNRSLEQIGAQALQQRAYQQKLEQENRQRQLQVLQEINPATLYPKFEREVVDQTIGELTAGMANYMKQNPNASYIDLQNMVNKNLGQIAQWSAKVKSVKENIDKTVSLMDPKSPYDKGRLRALAIDRALYKTDEAGRKIMKGADEIDLESDIISQVAAENEDKLIDPFKGEQAMEEKVNDAKEYTQDIEETIETPDGRKTVVKGKKSSVPFFLEAKDGELRVKQQPNGYIDENVFQRFYKDPAIRANINAEAKSNMKKIGVPDSPEAFEYFKRAYLTTWLEGNKKGLIQKVDKTLYQKPNAAVTVNVGGAGKPPLMAYQSLDNFVTEQFNKGGKNYKYSQVNVAPYPDIVLKYAEDALGVGNLTSADVKLIKDKDGRIGIYAARDIKGKPSIEDPMGVPNRKAGDKKSSFITFIDPDRFDVFANNILGQEAKTSAVGSNQNTLKKYNPKTGKFE